MTLGRILFFAFGVLFVSCGVIAVVSTTKEPATHFAAHEFALLRSDYESARSQGVARRAAVFRRLRETLDTLPITPGLAGAVAEFCGEVVAARDEHGEVKAEAKLALHALRSRAEAAPSVPASADRAPAAVAR